MVHKVENISWLQRIFESLSNVESTLNMARKTRVRAKEKPENKKFSLRSVSLVYEKNLWLFSFLRKHAFNLFSFIPFKKQEHHIPRCSINTDKKTPSRQPAVDAQWPLKGNCRVE